MSADMSALGWYVAAAFFALWFIEHVGGRFVRDELRAELKDAHDLLRTIFKAAYNPKPTRHLRSVDGGVS